MTDFRPKSYVDAINSYTSGGNITMTANILINTTTSSINTSSGGLVVGGGGGFNGNVYANNIYSNNLQLTPSPVNTKGDIYVFSSINDRLPASTDGSVLLSDSTVPLGLRWGVNSVYNEYYSVTSNSSVGTTSMNFILKTSLTTGNLSGGTYSVQIGYWINMNSNANPFEIDVFLNATNTTGSLIHQNIFKIGSNAFNVPFYDSVNTTIGSGISNVGIWYKVGGGTVNISNTRLSILKLA
jgi:hypothetical protein